MKTFYLISYFICWAIVGAAVRLPAIIGGASDREATLTILFGAIVGVVVAHFTRRWRVLHWISIWSGLAMSACGFIITICIFLNGGGGEYSGLINFIFLLGALYLAAVGLLVLGAGIFGRLSDRTSHD